MSDRPAHPEAVARARRIRHRLLGVGAVLALAAGLLIYKGLTSAIVYFKTADEALHARAALGNSTFQIEGVVVPRSVHDHQNGVDFAITAGGKTVAVENEGTPPALFQPNIPVVLVGHFIGTTDRFASNQILVKHSNQYIAAHPNRVRAPERQRPVNGALGHIGIALGLVGSFAAACALVAGLVREEKASFPWILRLLGLTLAGTLLATGAMEHALLTHDFSLSFVAQNNSRETPLLYDVTGLWSALQGSILLWTMILVGYVAITAWHFRKRASERVVRIALLVALGVTLFFFGLMAGPADPFAPTVGAIPVDGAGPNVLLQDNPLIAIHPVFLYLGFVGFTIPFAFAIATLVTGRVAEGWLAATRRYTAVAWACLTLGIVLGAWWSYQVLGWGGFWGWDPVENAALLPWLTGTAYLHSAMVEERRGLLRVWNLSLLIATFSLTILATFLTRSGIVTSVHAFSDSGIGPALIALFGLAVISGVGLIGWRGDRLRAHGTIDAPVSREGAFLVNNLLFAAFAFVVLLGTVFPLAVQAINGNAISIGRPYFDSLTVPLGVALLFFMAVAPVLPWRKAGPGVLRARLALPGWGALLVLLVCVAAGLRGLLPLGAFTLGAFAGFVAARALVLAAVTAQRHGLGWWRGIVGRTNGGMVAHLGIVVIAVGLTAASAYGHNGLVTLRRGSPVTFDGHTLELVGVTAFRAPNKSGVEAIVRVDGRGLFRPAFSIFNGNPAEVGTPAIDSSAIDDVYLSPFALPTPPIRGIPTVQLTVVVQPLVVWLWVGGALTAAGALLAAVPGRRRRPTDPVSVPLPELAPERLVTAGAAQ